jgi:hypothetical protein
VFILKVVKVVYFDTFLQVFILKAFMGAPKIVQIRRGMIMLRPACRTGRRRVRVTVALVAHTPPYIGKKRRQAAENKGNECGKETQEKTRGGKQMKRPNLRGKGGTIRVGGQRTSLSAVLQKEGYRMCYYFSS